MIFDQIRQGRISDNILAQIKNAIFTGVYKPGDKLPSEKELKEMFKVSRVGAGRPTRRFDGSRYVPCFGG